MISLLPPDPTSTERIACHSCNRPVTIPVVHIVDNEPLLFQLFEGKVNQAECPSCRQPVWAEIPILVSIPESCIPPIQYIPFDSLENRR